MIILYLGLLFGGVGLFLLSYAAQFRLAALLRRNHPAQWRIIAEPEHGKASGWRTWLRMQQALRSPAVPAMGDAALTRWRRVWLYSPWLGWACWLVALGMRLLLH